jgi:hypothetical protein
MDPIVFHSKIKTAIEKYFPESSEEIIERYPFYLKMRINLSDDIFISIRYNARNSRQDFALVWRGKRIVGYDNLGRWHQHPVEDPEKHIFCKNPTINQVFNYFNKVYEVISKI